MRALGKPKRWATLERWVFFFFFFIRVETTISWGIQYRKQNTIALIRFVQHGFDILWYCRKYEVSSCTHKNWDCTKWVKVPFQEAHVSVIWVIPQAVHGIFQARLNLRTTILTTTSMVNNAVNMLSPTINMTSSVPLSSDKGCEPKWHVNGKNKYIYKLTKRWNCICSVFWAVEST